MSTLRPEYGSGLKGDLFDLAHDVCATESELSIPWMNETELLARPPIFPAAFDLRMIQLQDFFRNRAGFLVTGFILDIDGEAIGLDLKQEVDLDDDPTASYLLERGRNIFDTHDHDVCRAAYAEPEISPESKLVTRRAKAGSVVV